MFLEHPSGFCITVEVETKTKELAVLRLYRDLERRKVDVYTADSTLYDPLDG